ncbi:MAG: ATP-grasp domain-containing protein [Methylococcaceae bacterium]|nr:ATP-grasp domain-containing protein [Methylococcaceae bacterium]
MKILVFEYICGGGFCTEELPDSLAKEGLLMLKALLNDLTIIDAHKISVLLDGRLINNFDDALEIIVIEKKDDILKRFKSELSSVDAVWLIAPESGEILFNLTQIVESANKLLLNSPSKAITQTADKWQTFKQLSTHNINSVSTAILNNNSRPFPQGTVIKSRDGVGCEDSFFINSEQGFQSLLAQLNNLENYIIQPFIEGEVLSVSALFNKGNAPLLCINRQYVEIVDKSFKLLACEVNCEMDNGEFQKLCTQMATAFPDLWGYVGIDLIRCNQQLQVLEINPRLTSSYAGIKEALGINVAAVVLQLLNSEPEIMASCNQPITVKLC